MLPETPAPARIILSILGLVAVIVSLIIGFINPIGLWHWIFLLVALGCLIASRRVH
ncbi:hypothetical protein [Candidatus Oscillochloris fontis]|uniref:hypothetical protein n=1 Tax=Candidatus Oscillochloris fontis TaxID=2496868 RepID=UPI001581A497|nr:hypothetical protein [Candidatus Oscillochloris fontis]